jgi:hypothetical protein
VGNLRVTVSGSTVRWDFPENEGEYGLGACSRFNSDQRGCSYDTDVPGAVKNVSALHPLGIALVTDDERIYAERARPIMEFLLSHEDMLFCTNPAMKIQNPGRLMDGADAYIAARVLKEDTSFERYPAFFWTQPAPDFVKLCDLYEETREWRYIQAAEIAARRAIFMADFAPWLMRIAMYTGNTYLHDIARSANRLFG